MEVIVGEFQNNLCSEIKSLEQFSSSGPSVLDTAVPLSSCHDLARISFGSNSIDELLTDGFSDEQIWQQLKSTLKNGESAFEDAFTALSRKRRRISQPVLSFKRPHVEQEDDSQAEEEQEKDQDDLGDNDDLSDDEHLKKICKGWQINVGESGEDDLVDDDDEDELNEDGLEGEVESGGEEEDGDNAGSSDDDYGIGAIKKSLKNAAAKRQSQVDDKFFNLADMTEFIEKAERLENQNVDSNDDDEDDDADYYKDSSDEDENDDKDAKYADFFDAPDGIDEDNLEGDEADDDDDDGEKDEGDDDEDDDDDSDEDMATEDKGEDLSGNFDEEMNSDFGSDASDDEMEDDNKETLPKDTEADDADAPKSAFQKRQELMRKHITEIEESNLKERPWYLKGEVTGADREKDSLLTRQIDYKVNEAPLIEDTDLPTAEEILRRNYESNTFVVNVTRKVKQIDIPLKYKKQIRIDDQQSKLGLAEVYEKEFLAQDAKKEEEDTEYKENRKILDDLLTSLRMLYSEMPVTVMPPKVELTVIENVPAIMVEDVAPVFVSDAARLTAEEIHGKRKSELIGETERTTTDKKRERRKKKKFQHHLALEKQKKAADPTSKAAQEEAQKKLEIMNRKGKRIKIQDDGKKKNKKMSSTEFFEKLQNQVTAKINKKKEKLDAKSKKQ